MNLRAVRAEFEAQPYRAQVARLRALGRRALERFGMPHGAPLRLLNHGENTTFRTLDGRGRSRVLRIHRWNYQTPAMVRSELEWLSALRRDTDLVVPRPHRGRDGAFVQQVAHPSVGPARICVLFDWVEGRFSRGRTGPTLYRRVGRLAATLHAHARTWKRPAGFRRRAWSADVLFGRKPGFGDPFLAPGLRASDRRLFERAIRRSEDEIAALGRGGRVWGLTHADLHGGNILFKDGVPAPIDFDDAGAGYYGYDLAVAIAPPWDRASIRQATDWLLEGYREIGPIDAATAAAIPCFHAVRRISMVGWIASRADNPRLRAFIPKSIERARASLKDYLAS